jgi:hypothetical protein
VNEEKSATRERAIQIKVRGAKNTYKLARTKERRLFRKKARQLDEEALIGIERNRSIQDSRKFYKHLNYVRRPFEPQVVMCRAMNDHGQLFALRQILEKCNLFINFKAAYDTIIRNEVYVGMSELHFPIKLIRLTKATLTIVTCCVKIQNDCFESFETRQGK